MSNPLDFRKSKIPVPESSFLSGSKNNGFLSDLSDQLFFDDTLTSNSKFDPVNKLLDKDSSYNNYGPTNILLDEQLPDSLSLTHLVSSPGGSSSVRKPKRKKPPDLIIRTTSDLIESKLEELLGPKPYFDDLIIKPLTASQSVGNLGIIQNETNIDSSSSASKVPFQRFTDRMDRKKSSSHSKLLLSSSNKDDDDHELFEKNILRLSEFKSISPRVRKKSDGIKKNHQNDINTNTAKDIIKINKGENDDVVIIAKKEKPSKIEKMVVDNNNVVSGSVIDVKSIKTTPKLDGKNINLQGNIKNNNLVKEIKENENVLVQDNNPGIKESIKIIKESSIPIKIDRTSLTTAKGKESIVNKVGPNVIVINNNAKGPQGTPKKVPLNKSNEISSSSGGGVTISSTKVEILSVPNNKEKSVTSSKQDLRKIESIKPLTTAPPPPSSNKKKKSEDLSEKSSGSELTKIKDKSGKHGISSTTTTKKGGSSETTTNSTKDQQDTGKKTGGTKSSSVTSTVPGGVKLDAVALALTKSNEKDKKDGDGSKKDVGDTDSMDTIRDSATVLRILHLTQKSDWHAVDQSLRFLEKAISLGITDDFKPLAEIADEETGWTPLMYAVKDNRIPLADRMIDLGCDVNARNKDSMTPLHLAALYARDETVKFLIFKRADVTAVTEGKKQNAVHLACTRPSGVATSILKVLLSVAPKDIRLQKDEDGQIPLFISLTSGTRGSCQELLSHLAHEQMRVKAGPRNDTALHMAIRKNDIEIARLFVDSGANVDAKNGDGQTPMHLAAASGDESILKFFYLCKANPNISDKEDRTPIHIAAQHGHTAIIELLADKFKVSVFERTRDGSTLMHIASLHGHPETAMALFRKGVPLQMPNKGGARSLHIAARHGHAAMISKLLEKGEKVDATTNDNYTALHIAVESGRPAVVETLLGHGAQVHIKGGKAQETPLHIAGRVNEGDKCALMLLKSGADPNIIMENGETPLHVAARHGRLRIIKLLLNDNADPIQRSNDGETPLHLACRFGHLRVVKELLQYIQKERGESDVTLYINTATNKGESALHYASRLSESTASKKDVHDTAREIAQLLLKGGASVYQQTKDTHETAFHYCAREGNNDILKEMLKQMTAVECQRALNKQSTKGWSPLLLACHKGHAAVVKTLLENNARVDVFDNEGRSALHLAAENGYQEVCGMLLKHKAFINSKSRTGFTALHLAAMKGYHKLCLFLIQDHSAYVDVVTLKKQTPLHLAAEGGQIEVCRLLMGLRANPDANDDRGQKPIHLAAENNHSDVIKLFLKSQPALVSSSTKDGSTCAHLAAMQGSVSVLEELMKFDKQGVISARNRSTDATALQLAAEGGHAELVKALLDAGASASDENRAGYAAVHLASKNGHTNVIDALRNSETEESVISLSSRKLGLTALHIAAFFGQTETLRELLSYIPATTPSDPPISLAASFLKELGTESGLTPLHLAAFSGEENVVRLLLNSQGVQVEAPTTNFGFNPLHLACRGGHATVVGLLLSRSSELLESKDNEGKTGLHIAAVHGHQHMVEILLGQGAEIDSVDKMAWTPLHCAAKAGHLEVVKLLVESGASPLTKTSKGQYPIWFAAAEGHNNVLSYLMKKEHDSYGLMEDREFVYNLTVCGKNNQNEPLNDFILSSPAPVDIAAKLSNILLGLSTREKERAKDLIAASKSCETMAAELLALASGSESAGKLLRSIDRRSVQFLDILIENEQKEVIAHSAVQRYLSELWVGTIKWSNWKLLLLFMCFILCPPVWIVFSLPLGHRFHKIPIIKFMSYLTSHIYLMVLLCLISITPIYPILRFNFFPYWHEWILLAWLIGLIISEVANPSDKAGLGWIKVAVLLFCILAVILHGVGFFVGKQWCGHIFYLRNQLFAMAILSACVQVLDFLSFHYLFGPWAIIIGNLMKDLARFLAVLAIFMVGFSMVITSLNQPFYKRGPDQNSTKTPITNGLPSGVLITPIDAFEVLFFALFGQKMTEDLKFETAQPPWTILLFKLVFAGYLLVTVIVLINLLIAMMSDTYQRIQAQSDIEWKFGLAKLIRNMHRTSATPSPINLFTSWFIWIVRQCKKKREPFNPLKWERKGAPGRGGGNIFKFGKPTPQQRWKTVFNKAKVTPRVSDIMRLSVAQVSPMTPGSPLHPLGSTMSMHHQQRIETVADWTLVAKKYRILVGSEEPTHIEPVENIDRNN